MKYALISDDIQSHAVSAGFLEVFNDFKHWCALQLRLTFSKALKRSRSKRQAQQLKRPQQSFMAPWLIFFRCRSKAKI